MFSIRRYTVYIGLAAFILFTFAYFRRGDLATAQDRLFDYANSLTNRPAAESKAGTGKLSQDGRFRWETFSNYYPIETDRLSALPTAAPRKLPKVQYEFPEETEEHAKVRKERQAAVKKTFERCWSAYKQHAWGHDELAPLSGGVRDGFGGWAASLVDNLDNLWIMDLKSEFEEAVQAAVDIDLGKSATESINVFETTIRHLGGFLAAYDLSGDKRLLEKAKEFGEMLIKAFDTPNHLPITRWKPQEYLKSAQEADGVVLVAEIGSLEMEFTRLSQVTGDHKFYDAVARIIRLFDAQQEKTHLPGMWPVVVNAKLADLTQDTFFTLSAMSDSLYEYFPKMHALLGGTETVYKKLYEGSMATAIKYNLWRPMVPDNADILLSGNVRASDQDVPRLFPQGQHLVCFAGGMFALGGKLFEQPSHVEIGKKLTDGCIWTYKALPLGIMPEVFEMVPCDSITDCKWDEKRWHDEISAIHHSQGSANPDKIIKDLRLPPGFTDLSDRRYILRPEAIESVFILYRITGDENYFEAAWEMFEAITKATETKIANAALSDISFSAEELKQGNTGGTTQMDSMESFWMAETLKYFYLVFSEPEIIDLDEWVFNTEAHPFRRALPTLK
jgi:mannosyl-oligosaccharide alpha-1,2-mannosidase